MIMELIYSLVTFAACVYMHAVIAIASLSLVPRPLPSLQYGKVVHVLHATINNGMGLGGPGCKAVGPGGMVNTSIQLLLPVTLLATLW